MDAPYFMDWIRRHGDKDQIVEMTDKQIEDEYCLILAKQSRLSRMQRDKVVRLVEGKKAHEAQQALVAKMLKEQEEIGLAQYSEINQEAQDATKE